jgi:hypothetical protein
MEEIMSDQQGVVEQAVQPSGSPATSPVNNNVTSVVEQAAADWKTSLAEDIRADKSLAPIKDINSLAKSYIHAQKLVGVEKIPLPNKHATEEDWNVVYDKLGRPKSPEEYKYNISEDTNIDEGALKIFSEQAHKLGLLPQQADGVVKFYNDMMAENLKSLDAAAETARVESEQQLRKEFGRAFEQKITKASQLAREYVGEDILNMNLESGVKLGDHPQVVKAFAKLAEMVGEDNFVAQSGPNYLTPNEIENEIAKLQAPGSAYWNKSHPNHDKAVQEVFALRQQLTDV